jgi:hypothetical protein
MIVINMPGFTAEASIKNPSKSAVHSQQRCKESIHYGNNIVVPQWSVGGLLDDLAVWVFNELSDPSNRTFLCGVYAGYGSSLACESFGKDVKEGCFKVLFNSCMS